MLNMTNQCKAYEEIREHIQCGYEPKKAFFEVISQIELTEQEEDILAADFDL